MVKFFTAKTERSDKTRASRRTWSHFVRVMAMVVVFCTTYALILPAITIESGTICGIGEHTHNADCYQAAETVACTIPESEGHAHGDACYTEEKVLTCTLEEAAAHAHSDECGGKTLTCTLQEAEGHTHSDACSGKTLTCTVPEEAAHTHTDACNTQVSTLVCTEAESETHVHGDACYQVETQTCGLAETAGHTHTDACYTVAVCELAESEGHTHGDACYTAAVCELAETEGHTHTDACYEIAKTLTCTLEESEGHSHADDEAPLELVCELNEHVHTEACYPATEETTTTDTTEQTEQPVSDPTADVETAEDWEASMAAVALTGDWSADLLAIAKSQMGYTESTRNFTVSESGSVSGYTRYGAWYGIPYGDWCAMFVSFCLEYAGVEDIVRHCNTNLWAESLIESNQYFAADQYTPVPGDIMFIDWNANGQSDHVGIVEQIITPAADAKDQTVKIRVIEGNSSNRVQYVDYAVDDACILGYGVLPTEPGPTYEYTDGNVSVKVVLPLDTTVPEDAALSVTPIEPDAQGYDDMVAKATDAVTGTVTKIALYDISFYAADGTYIPVDDEAKVSLRFVESPVDTEAKVEVLHFDDNAAAPVVLSGVTVAEEAPIVEEEPKTLDELAVPDMSGYEIVEPAPETVVEFTTDGFSTFAIVQTTSQFPVPEYTLTAMANGDANAEGAKDDVINGLDGKTVVIAQADMFNNSGMTRYALTANASAKKENRLASMEVTRDGESMKFATRVVGQLLWKFEANEDTAAQNDYYIKSVSTGRYLVLDDDGNELTLGEKEFEKDNKTIVNSYYVFRAPNAGYAFVIGRGDQADNLATDDRDLQFASAENELYFQTANNPNDNTGRFVFAEMNDLTAKEVDAVVDGQNHPLNGKVLAIVSAYDNVTEDEGGNNVTTRVYHGVESSLRNDNQLKASTVTKDGDTYSVSGTIFWKFEAANEANTYYISVHDYYADSDIVGKYLQIQGDANIALVEAKDDACKIVVSDEDATTNKNNAGLKTDDLGFVNLRRVNARYLAYNVTDNYITAYNGNDLQDDFLLLEVNVNTSKINKYVTNLGGKSLAIVSVRDDSELIAVRAYEVDDRNPNDNATKTNLEGYEVQWKDKENKIITVPDSAPEDIIWTFEPVDAPNGVYYVKAADGKYMEIGTDGYAYVKEIPEGERPQEITVISNEEHGDQIIALSFTKDNNLYCLNEYGGNYDTYGGWGADLGDPGCRFVLAEAQPEGAMYATVLSRTELIKYAKVPGARLVYFVRQGTAGNYKYYALKADGSAHEIQMQGNGYLQAGSVMWSESYDYNMLWDGTNTPTGGWNSSNDANGSVDLLVKNVGTGEYLVPHREGDDHVITDAPKASNANQPNLWRENFMNYIGVKDGDNPNTTAALNIDTDIANMIITNTASTPYSKVRLTFDGTSKFETEYISSFNNDPKPVDANQKNIIYVALVHPASLNEEVVSEDKNLVGQILTREEIQDAAMEYGANWPFILITRIEAKDVNGVLVKDDNGEQVYKYYAMDSEGNAQEVEFIKSINSETNELELNTLEAGGRFIFQAPEGYNSNKLLWNTSWTSVNDHKENDYDDGWVELWLSSVATGEFICPNGATDDSTENMFAGFPLEGEHNPGFFYVADLTDNESTDEQKKLSYLGSYLASRLGSTNDEGKADGAENRYHIEYNATDNKFVSVDGWSNNYAANGGTLDNMNGRINPHQVFYVAMLVDKNVTYVDTEEEIEEYELDYGTIKEYQPISAVNENVEIQVFNYGAAIDYFGQVYNDTKIREDGDVNKKPLVPDHLDYGDDLVYRFFYRPSFDGEAIDGTNDPNNGDGKENLYSDGSDPLDNGNYRMFAKTLVNGYPAILQPRDLSCTTTAHTHGENCTLTCTSTEAGHVHTGACYSCGTNVHTHNRSCYEGETPRVTFNNADHKYVGCTLEAHTHDAGCLGCDSSAGEHVHVASCYDCGKMSHVHNASCSFSENIFSLGYLFGDTDSFETNQVSDENAKYSSLDLRNSTTNNWLTVIEGNNGTEVNSVEGRTPPADENDSVANNPNYAVRTYDVVRNLTEGTGLFQKDEMGYYYYDSKVNAAVYNEKTKRFELYDFAVIPNGYTNLDGGNFLPFNNAVTQGRYITAEQIEADLNGDGTSGNGLGGDAVRPTLEKAERYYKLNGFQQDNDYTNGRESMADLWVGMSMEIDFDMTRDGKVRVTNYINMKDAAGNSIGRRELVLYSNGANDYWYDAETKALYDDDGKNMGELSDEYTEVRNDMIFHFDGDDDVLVYIDDVLVMDMNGIHGVWTGDINFHTGVVTNDQYSGAYTNGMNLRTLYEQSGLFYDEEIEEIFGNNDGIATAAADEGAVGTGDNTFEPYTHHTLKFFYLERGGNISDCAITFNLEPQPQGGLSVSKNVEGIDENNNVTDADGNTYSFEGEYTFQLVDIIQPYDLYRAINVAGSEGVISEIPYEYKKVDGTTETGMMQLTPVTEHKTLKLDGGGEITKDFEVCRYYLSETVTTANADNIEAEGDKPAVINYYTVYRYKDEDGNIWLYTDENINGIKDQQYSEKAHDPTDTDGMKKFYRVFKSERFTMKNGETWDFNEFILNTLVKVKEYPARNGVQLGTTYWWETDDKGVTMEGIHAAEKVSDGSLKSQYFKIEDQTKVRVVCNNILQPVNLGIRDLVYKIGGTEIDTTSRKYTVEYAITYPDSDFLYQPEGKEELYRLTLDGNGQIIDFDAMSDDKKKETLLRTEQANTWEQSTPDNIDDQDYGDIVDTKESINAGKGAFNASYSAESNIVGTPIQADKFCWTVNIPFGSKVTVKQVLINGHSVGTTSCTKCNGGYCKYYTTYWSYEGWSEVSRPYAMQNLTFMYDKDNDGDEDEITINVGELIAVNGDILNPMEMDRAALTEGADYEYKTQYMRTDNGAQSEVATAAFGDASSASNLSSSGATTHMGASTSGITMVSTDNYISISNTPNPATFDLTKTITGNMKTSDKFKFSYSTTGIDDSVTGDLELQQDVPSATIQVPFGCTVTITEDLDAEGMDKYKKEFVKYSYTETVIETKYVTDFTLSNEAQMNQDSYVGAIGNGNTLSFTYNAVQNGAHTLRLWYSSDANRSFAVTVNGGTPINVDCASNGSWTAFGPDENPEGTGYVEVPVTLTEGSNTIVIGGTANADGSGYNWAPNLQNVEINHTEEKKSEGSVSFDAVANGHISITCSNTPGYELPMTGGEGTLMYILGGLFFMAVPVVYYGISKRSRRERRAGA